MRISGINFSFALKLFIKGGRVGYEKQKSCPTSKESGVYVVIKGKREIVYIGSYQHGIVQRWGTTGTQEVYHFKKDIIRKFLRKHELRVFAQDEKEIKRQLGQRKNEWVNCQGIESRLIFKHNKKPIWNKLGNSKWSQSK